MQITKAAMAGSLESNDVLITLRPWHEEEIELQIESIVKQQFSDRIEQVIRQVLEEFNVTSAHVQVQDRGALDCTLRARMETALTRAEEEKKWEK